MAQNFGAGFGINRKPVFIGISECIKLSDMHKGKLRLPPYPKGH